MDTARGLLAIADISLPPVEWIVFRIAHFAIRTFAIHCSVYLPILGGPRAPAGMGIPISWREIGRSLPSAVMRLQPG